MESICRVLASNEQHDKDSLNETGSTTGGTVEGVPAGAPNRGERNTETETAATEATRSAPSRSLVSRILSRTRSTNDLLDHSEPFSQLWVILSNVYGQLIVVLMIALCLAEVMDTPVPLLSLQGIFLMYLYVGSIAVIISIYIWVLVDSCGSFGTGAIGVDDAELGGASLTRFGSLKRAHISRSRTAPTSFYIRVGALLFGLATLVFNGLEMAMHSMMQGTECLSDVVFVHPVLHGLFTFLQMHFLFVNSQVLVERFGLAARFGFIHLTATNIAVWVRLVIWDSAQEWTYFVHLAQRGLPNSASPLNLRGFPESLIRRSRDLLSHPSVEKQVFQPYQPISNEQISQVIALQECLNTNTLGQLWTSSMPFLYPFIVQFSLIAAAVTFVMGQNVGRNRLLHKQKFHGSKDLTSHTKVGCDGSSKGLFLGILCMVAGIVVILIFLVVREDEHFPSSTLSWLTCGTLTSILTLSALMTASGLVQVRQMSVVSRAPAILDTLLSNVALFGVQLYSIFTIVVSACSLALLEDEDDETRGRHIMLLTASILQLIQCFAQSTLIAETSKRSCITRFQIIAKPARQVITFLLFSNSVLWAFDTVITQNWISQELQLRFFGVLAWGIISRIGLPLLIFYRFHSCVLLLEALQPRSHRSYRRRKVTINLQRDNDRSSTIQRSPKKLICPNLWTTSSTSFVPFVDNRLYFDPGSLLRVASPAVDPLSFDHVVPSSRQTRHHHHHHHHRHHHHHHHHHRKHRRVVSDPGTRDWNVSNQDTKRHRRMFSYDTGITGLRLIDEAELAETDRQAPSPDETKTSTFRKVPWHPNLHMLKIRRT
ncbi:hypothetical protein E2986_01047 [Frieseomelitta varia]|uniref:Otopetrin-3 n=1 Tax=Frieseomelitta varia TaxID=561572 RepID=A0A833R9Q9_9HYME|nr:hypothetical protein E2986_01047 [Frieseomelitta varia]